MGRLELLFHSVENGKSEMSEMIFDFPIKSNCHPKFEIDAVTVIYPSISGVMKELQLNLMLRRALPQDFLSVSALAHSKL